MNAGDIAVDLLALLVIFAQLALFGFAMVNHCICCLEDYHRISMSLFNAWVVR